MSAYAGFVSLNGAGVPPGTDERLRLGLDGKGLGKAVTRRLDGGVCVFRQRIASPEDRLDHQPVSGNGPYISLFDGRLDNRSELLAALGLRESPETPMADGAIVSAAYGRWMEGAVPRLLGDFAWTVWNARDRCLLLARDHGVTRSLFYTCGDGFVAFATGYRPLLALPEVPREVDEFAVADLLLTSPDDSERSFYKGIAWVGSAERVTVSTSGVRRERMWEPAVRPTLRLPRDQDYIEAAREVFDSAVSCRLRVAGPVLSSVTGGLDASAVAATAAALKAPEIVHGLCVVPSDGAALNVRPGRYPDERPFVTSLAARWPNLRVEFLQSVEARALELDPRGLFLENGVPLRAPSNAAWFLPMFERAAELGAGTLLQGDMGNFTFSTNGFERFAALRDQRRWLVLAAELMALRQTMPRGQWGELVRHQIRSVLPPAVRGAVRTLSGRPPRPPPPMPSTLLNPEFVRSAGLAERRDEHGIETRDFDTADGMARMLRYILQRSRMLMEQRAVLRNATGIVLSDPFADRRVIDFCLSLPSEQFLHRGEWRRLARRAFADRLPPGILENRRRGAQNPDWHRRLTPHRHLLAEHLERLEEVPLARRLLDVARMREILATWPDDPAAVEGEGLIYRTLLARALHVGQYLAWIDGSNRS